MPDLYPRSALRADAMYFLAWENQYFYTPDGTGGFWYATEAEAFAAHGKYPVVTIHQQLEE
jgi:hypothetical protein